MGVLPVPARPAADPAVAADPAGARKYTPRAYILGRIWKYLRGFRLSSAPYGVLAWVRVQGTAYSGPGSRQRTAAPPRPGHSLREYMQPALASASVEVAQTSGGCDSRRRARQEKPGPPARSRRSEADSRVGRWNHRTSPSAHPHPHPRRLGGVPARKEVACDLRSTAEQTVFLIFPNKLLMCLVAASFSQHLRLVMSGSRRGRFSWQL